MAVVVIMSGALVILFCLGAPAVGRMVRPFALEQVHGVEASLRMIDAALAMKDWQGMHDPENKAVESLNRLTSGPAIASLMHWSEPPVREDLRGQLNTARDAFRAVQNAIQDENAERAATELQKFRQAFEPLREAAKRPGR
jgi:hypothetical protein